MSQQKKMKKMPAIEVFKDVSGYHRFRIKAGNGEIIAQSESYANIRNIKKGIEALADAMWMYECRVIEIKKIQPKEETNVNQEKSS